MPGVAVGRASCVGLLIAVAFGSAGAQTSAGAGSSSERFVKQGVRMDGPAQPAGAAGPAQPAAGATPQKPAGSAPAASKEIRVIHQSGANAAGAAGAASGMPTPYPSPKVDLVQESLDEIAPLSPEEVIAFRKELKRRDDAARVENVMGGPPPKPGMVVYQVELSPKRDVAPPVVRVTPGQGSVVAFVDAAGRPWRIVEAENFGRGVGIKAAQFTDFQLAISVAPNAQAGNIAVALEGLNKTITFTVVTGQRETDYAVQMVVPKFKDGPPPQVGAAGGEVSLGGNDLIDFALRTPPASARELVVVGLEGAQAWQTTPTRMVVRTDALLSSPGFFRRRESGIDGYAVYELPLTPAILATTNGRFVTLRVSGFLTGGSQ